MDFCLSAGLLEERPGLWELEDDKGTVTRGLARSGGKSEAEGTPVVADIDRASDGDVPAGKPSAEHPDDSERRIFLLLPEDTLYRLAESMRRVHV